MLSLKVAVCLLCVNCIWSAPKFEKKQRKKPESLQDFGAVFKSAVQDATDKAVRLGTKRVEDAFDDVTDSVRSEFDDVMTSEERTRLKSMRNLQCPDGTKAFNLSRVALKDAIEAANDLSSLLTQLPASVSGGQGPAQGGQRFLRIVCWTGTKELLKQHLQTLEKRLIRRLFRAKLLALLAKRVAEQLSSVLPDSTKTLLCEELKKADTADLATVAKRFPCRNELKEEACSDPAMAEALLEDERERGMDELTGQEWTDVLDKFGNCTPPDFLRHAPKAQLQSRFADLFSEETAVALMAKIDFETANGDFVKSLGDKTCNITTSSLMSISADSLRTGKSSLSCMKKEKNKVKKRKLADKMLGTRNATKCKDYFDNVSPADKKCWKLMTGDDLEDIDFTAIDSEDLDGLDCETLKDVKQKRQLGKLSSWSAQDLETYQCLIGSCMDTGDLDDQDAEKMADAMVNGKLTAIGKLSPAVQQKLKKKLEAKLRDGQNLLDASDLVRMKPVLGAMTRTEVEELSPDVVNQALPQLLKELGSMKKPALRGLLRKLNPDQLKNRLCDFEEIAEEVPSDILMSVADLWDTLSSNTDCKFKCGTQEQSAVVYAKMKEALTDWASAGREVLDRLREIGVLCGMPLEDVTELQPDGTFMDLAGAFFTSKCNNPKMTQLFFDKLAMYMTFYAQRLMSAADIELVGGNYFKHMSPDDFTSYSQDKKLAIFQSIGQSDLSDVDTPSVRALTAAAVDAYVGANERINGVAVLFLGSLLCGLDSSHVSRMMSDALTDALPQLSECPDVAPTTLRALQEAIKNTMNLDYGSMTAADVALGGIALLSDCDNVDLISDEAKSEAAGDLAEAANRWQQKRKERAKKWRDSDDQKNQDQMEQDIRCGLKKMVSARPRVRNQNGARRRKRSTGTFTCDDIRLLREEAVILSEQDIAALSNDDFSNCADVLGSVGKWSQAQKEALANKAKQVWGAVNTWTSGDTLLTAGTIVQGLTPQELASMQFTLQQLEALGQHDNWMVEQLKEMFSSWLNSDASVSAGPSAITSSQLQQLGHVVCGATAQQISDVTSQAYRGAMSDVGDARNCSTEQRQAWARLAVQTLGPVTSWSLAQTAAVDMVLAGLASHDLSQLSSSQLSVMDLDTFAAIPPTVFASLTVSQLESLSTQHALVITEDQFKNLNGQQKTALQNLGVTFVKDDGGSAGGLAAAVKTVVVMMTIALIMIQA